VLSLLSNTKVTTLFSPLPERSGTLAGKMGRKNVMTPTPGNSNTIKLTAQFTSSNEDIVHGEYDIGYSITNPSNQPAYLETVSLSNLDYDLSTVQLQGGQSTQTGANLTNPGTIWHTGLNPQLVIRYHDAQNNPGC
jgi:hypothetical protein